MRKWCSNAMRLMERIESVEKEQVVRENNSHQSNKVLGILWDNEADLLKIDLEEVLINMNTDVLTKRMILSTTDKLFRPSRLDKACDSTIKDTVNVPRYLQGRN